MKKEDIHWDDWHRILIGAAPTAFLIEVLIRSILLFLFLLLVLRLMGKRMGGMLTISELAVMLTLGAIICVPMQIPDKGVLQGFLALICALAFQRWFNLIGVKLSFAEKLIQGTETIIIKDGAIDIKSLKKSNISHQQLYAILRSQNIYNLGNVERVYLEASGLFSVYIFKEPRLGLSLLPTKDTEAHQIQEASGEQVCTQCGFIKQTSELERRCYNCDSENWTPAITS